MESRETFDVAVIGAGPGGYVAAIRAAQLGLKVALVEKEATLGGTCLNVGCIPSKALLESSELFEQARTSLAAHGITTGPVEVDLGRMMARKEELVRQLTSGIALLMKKNKVTVLRGTARLSGGAIQVAFDGEMRQIRATHTVLATGSKAMELRGLPFDGRNVLSSTEALCLDRVPDHLVVVGAGAVGLELGSVWHRLGAQVTVVELLPHILPFADRQAAGTLQRALARKGMVFRLATRVESGEISSGRVSLTLADNQDKKDTLTCDKVLVAIGRAPAADGLGLEETGVRKDGAGRIEVDASFSTGIPGLYAIGDLIRGPMLAHKASEEGVAVAERIAGKPGIVRYETIPNVVYTSPELAQVGLTEEEAKGKGISFKVGRFFFKANGRAKCLGEEEGLVKIIADAETDRLLGVHIVGPRASELVAEAVALLEFGASAEDLARTAHAHPTLSEALKEAALAVDRRSIHG